MPSEELILAGYIKKACKDILLTGFLFGVSERSAVTMQNPTASNMGLLVVGALFLISVLVQYLPDHSGAKKEVL